MKKLQFFAAVITALTLQNPVLAEEKTLEFSLVIKEHKFIPDILEVPANQKFKLIVDNQDETAEEFESTSLGKEKIIMGRKKATLIITPLKSGEYDFFGEFHPHEAKGKIIAK